MTPGSLVIAYVLVVGSGFLVSGVLGYLVYDRAMRERRERKDLTRLGLEWALTIDAASIAAIASTATARITGQDIQAQFDGVECVPEEVLARIALIRRTFRGANMTNGTVQQLLSSRLADLRNLDDTPLQKALVQEIKEAYTY